jgi:threonine synthase
MQRMRFKSTRGDSPETTLSVAIEQGLAPDGGLYVPSEFPKVDVEGCARTLSDSHSLPALATRLLTPFFEGDALAGKLSQICERALNFPIPLRMLPTNVTLLELFHGPTAAFKDVGARFLAECFAEIPQPSLRTILVATSGDTGGAVASAFYGKSDVEVAILFPRGGVSPLQERQLTCWGGNVRSFAVRGNFDDCQRLVKAAFAERATPGAWGQRHLTSANSISLGRLLPQMVYYAFASLEYHEKTGQKPGFVIPSGNLGNALAALWAMKAGFPVREILMATNANRAVPDYFETGEFKAVPSRKTLANAMDVGNPSNLERVTHLFGGSLEDLKRHARAISVSDEEIRSAIVEGAREHGEIFCPHTAAAYAARKAQTSAHWILVATADPAKFNEVVEPLLGVSAPVPPQLSALLKKPSHFSEIDADLAALKSALA